VAQDDDLIDGNKAQRKALFAILARLGNGGGAAPAT
jgi:hypothetical protein